MRGPEVEGRGAGDGYSGVTRDRPHTLVHQERARFANARVHAFVPILVERAVRTTLAAPPAKHRPA